MHRFILFFLLFALSEPLVAMQPSNLATPLYQQMGKAAQTELGIPTDKQLPIKNMSEPDVAKHPLQNFVVEGNDGIYINSKRFDERSHGFRAVLFANMAAAHKYRQETTVSSRTEKIWCGLTLGSLGFMALFGRLDPIYLAAILPVSWSIGGLLVSTRNRSVFKKEDQTAAKQVKCSECLDDFGRDNQDSQKGWRDKAGDKYFSAEEWEKVADQYRAQNKKCDFHAWQNGTRVKK